MNCGKVDFQGLYSHCGNSYKGSNSEEIQNARDDNIVRLYELAKMLKENAIEVKCQGIGSTPSCNQPNPRGIDGLTEIHPGNYVFYDLMQHMVIEFQWQPHNYSCLILARVLQP